MIMHTAITGDKYTRVKNVRAVKIIYKNQPNYVDFYIFYTKQLYKKQNNIKKFAHYSITLFWLAS